MIKKGFIIIWALISFGLTSSCAKTSDLEIVKSSTTASIDGNYTSTCESDGTNSVQVAFKIESGNTYAGVFFFQQNTTCTGTYDIRKMSDFSIITELNQTATNIHFLPLTNMPTNFFTITADNLENIGKTDYVALYKPDADHLYLLTDSLLNNPGPAWSDWEAASIDVAGFAAAPTTYTPSSGGAQGGGDSSTIALIKVSSF